MKKILVVMGILMSCFLSVAFAENEYDLIGIGGLPYSSPQAINNNSQIVGGMYVEYSYQPAFLRDYDGTLYKFGPHNYSSSVANGVNDAGQAVGVFTSNRHASLWDNGTITDLGVLPYGDYSTAYAINSAKQIVGSSRTYDANHLFYGDEAFIWENGAMRNLGTLGGGGSSAYDINKFGQVVGNAATATGNEHAFLWENEAMHDLGTLGGSRSTAFGINDLGQVVGWSYSSGGNTHAFLWENGVMQDLGSLGDGNSAAHKINNLGQIIGSANDHGFLWDKGVMYNINTLLAANAQDGIADALDINDKGEIIGIGDYHGLGGRGVYLLKPAAVTPEPISSVLFLLGGAALVSKRVLKKKQLV